MEFNLDKYKVLHFGRLNQGRTCTINDRAFESVVEKGGLGVQVHGCLKMATKVDRMMKKVYVCLYESR